MIGTYYSNTNEKTTFTTFLSELKIENERLEFFSEKKKT